MSVTIRRVSAGYKIPFSKSGQAEIIRSITGRYRSTHRNVMANQVQKANFVEEFHFDYSFYKAGSEGHRNRNVPAKTQNGQHFQLRQSLCEMNDCVRELSFHQHSSPDDGQHHVSGTLTNANLAKKLDDAVLDAIASTVSAFCSFPSSPTIRKRNASSIRRDMSVRLPCYGKELSPLKKTSPVIPSDRSVDLRNQQPFPQSNRRPFPVYRKRNLRSLSSGLKKVGRYFKMRKSQKTLLPLKTKKQIS